MNNSSLLTPPIMNYPQYPVFGYQQYYPQMQVPATYYNFPMTQIIPQNCIMTTNNLQPQYQYHQMHVIANCKLPVVNLSNPINYHFIDNKLSNSNSLISPQIAINKELL